ncbi:equilibrative nucleoside transporter 3-like [Xenia sp. Carnegie-2017]|uniref:equilibrative nucleoside transporter 3-like n=1 Tax=Xenia sp. Carnegie-2017 TaxID=2897299 RepID=UPI001F04CD22|nr:equilibrative nucleoside transporter 3-like [Xenia sp. Carnegie-2017]
MNERDESVEGLVNGQRKIPKDRFNLVYFVLLLQGIGTVLPWNFFITAQAYFSTKLKNTNYQDEFENFFSLAACGPLLLAFLLNTMFKHKAPLKKRIIVPLILMIVIFIVTTILVKIDVHKWKGLFFAITLIIIALINAFGAVYQGGIFGLAGMMPPQYTQALMTGQGVAGIFACVADISSKLGSADPYDSAFWYFLTAVVVLIICMISYLGLYKIRFSKHFLDGHREAVYCAVENDKVENNFPEHEVKLVKSVPPFKLIMKKIWHQGLSVVLVFLVTLATFPAVLSGIKSENNGDGSEWTGKFFTPVVCFLLFNVGDFAGRVIAGFVQKPGPDGYWMLGCTILRFVFIPLFAFCNYQPRRSNATVYFKEDYWPVVFNLLFSVSNGYLGSLCMMYGPDLVESKHAETAGTIMAYFLAIGLGLGSASSFGITESI